MQITIANFLVSLSFKFTKIIYLYESSQFDFIRNCARRQNFGNKTGRKIEIRMKPLPLKKIIALILFVIFFLTIIYVEGNGFEFQRLIAGLIRVLEVVLVVKVISWIDLLAIDNKWKTAEKTAKIIGVSIGLLFIMLAIDRMVNHTLTSCNLDYAITWTIIFPFAVIIAYSFRAIDFYLHENERKKIHGR